MIGAIGLLETTGLTPAMVAIDGMLKAAAVRIQQVELNDLYGVCVKITGSIADVQTAIQYGRLIAERMNGNPVATVLTQPIASAVPGIHSENEFNALIQQDVVFDAGKPTDISNQSVMNQQNPPALGFIETQGFTAVFEAIDTACKAADVEVVGKEKLGGGFVTVVLQGELSAVTAAVEAGKAKVDGLGKLIAAHVVARPADSVLKLLPRL
ncbi:MAG: BMC domain-containing protein [Verrucomicrobia bacterium]|nr:BMC domain-containing protein [Verrucomicrobiota bacterium]